MTTSADSIVRPSDRTSLLRLNTRPGIPSLYTVAAIAILGAIFLVALAPKLDTDLWWHLKVGQYIAAHHAVPSRDFLSFTFAGRSWTDHEWLSELLLYGAYRVGGLWGTIAVFALIIWATYALVYRQMRSRNTHPIVALVVLTLAFIASSPTWAARPQMITLLFLATYSMLLFQFSRTRNPRWLLAFPALMVLWANLHGGWVLGLVLLGVTLCGEGLNTLTHRPEAWSPRELRLLGLTLVACVVTTVLNPNGVSEVLYPLVWILPTDYTNSLTEWVSPNFHMLQMMAFEVLLLALVAAVYVARAGLDWARLLIALVFTYLALAEGRNVAVWTVVVTPVLAAYLTEIGPRLRELFPRAAYRRRPVSGRIGNVLNLALLILVALAYVAEGSHFINATQLQSSEQTNFPAGAVSYLQNHSLDSRVFASYAWDGYLLWKAYPRYRDFIDGRANTLFDSAILQEYIAVSTAAPNWAGVLRRHAVGTVVVETSSPLATVLSHDRHWKTRYRDAVAAVYSRR